MRHNRQFHKSKQAKNESFENDIKTMMEQFKELEGKLQEWRPRNQYNNTYTVQIHSIEELYDEDNLEQEALLDEETQEDEFGTLQNMGACYT